jgi:hypothetical protein
VPLSGIQEDPGRRPGTAYLPARPAREPAPAPKPAQEQAGFRLEEEERHRSFGHDLIGQTWRLPLA